MSLGCQAEERGEQCSSPTERTGRREGRWEPVRGCQERQGFAAGESGEGCRGTDSECSLHFNKRGGRGVGIEVQVWMLKSQRGTAFKFKGSLTVYQGL